MLKRKHNTNCGTKTSPNAANKALTNTLHYNTSKYPRAKLGTSKSPKLHPTKPTTPNNEKPPTRPHKKPTPTDTPAQWTRNSHHRHKTWTNGNSP